MSKSDGGKGSSPRPFSVSQAEYDARWDAIFSRDLETDTTESSPTAADLSTVEDDEESLQCPQCGGIDTMYRRPHWMYNMCDQCGYTQKLEVDV